ncbi:hypothetical protein ACFWOJ_39780 [Streptomyces sp. NPDC058439]|uniref:hypothetical protein n=1 Tax=Streptomyces sp. NPDC058439 TaxID=3346500 RepID=UPI0036609FB5
MTLAALYDFLPDGIFDDVLSNLIAGLVISLGGLAVKKLRARTSPRDQNQNADDQPPLQG